MQSFNDLFEELLEKKCLDVAVAGTGAESLRSSLSRRWSKYKKTYDELGFLADELRDLSLTMKVTDSGVRFSLMPNVRKVSYQILPIIESNNE